MNSNQRRKAKRAFLHKYKHRIYYDAISAKNLLDALLWCKDNIKKYEWTTCDEFNGVVMNTYKAGSLAAFRFRNHKDAMLFTLLWVGQ